MLTLPTPGPSATRHPIADEIMAEVAAYYGITSDEIRSTRRKASILEPGVLACLLMRELTPMTLAEIGKAVGPIDHTSVMNRLKVARQKIDSDAVVAGRLKYLRGRIQAKAIRF